MANRRMFSKKVSESTRFLRMSESARLLYYDLGMEADDEGFVEARNVVRMTGARLETLNELADNKYICILNEYGLCWLTCWFENNYIQSDRKQPSAYHHYLDALREQYPIEDIFTVEDTDVDITKLGKVRVSSNVSTDVYSDVSNHGYKNNENVYSNVYNMDTQRTYTQDRLGQGSLGKSKNSIDAGRQAIPDDMPF